MGNPPREHLQTKREADRGKFGSVEGFFPPQLLAETEWGSFPLTSYQSTNCAEVEFETR